MITFKYMNMVDAYPAIGERLIKTGIERSPRGMRTYNLRDVIIEIAEPNAALPFAVGRKLNLRIAAVEALQLIGGFSDPSLNIRASKNFAKYTELDGTFWAPYGLRTRGQVHKAIRKLMADKDTRQAVVTIWDPSRDNLPGKHDYPCTVALTFSIELDKLCLSVLMRSNDFWLGLPYDVFQFTQLQMTVARALGIEAGAYVHHAVSLHAYERDWDRIEELFFHSVGFRRPNIDGISCEPLDDALFEEPTAAWQRWEIAQERAVAIAKRDMIMDMTEGEIWYANQIEKLDE